FGVCWFSVVFCACRLLVFSHGGDNKELEAWEVEQNTEPEDSFSELRLVGCFLTATTINFQAMRTVLANLWHPLGGVSIADVGEKRFVFQFYCEMGFDRVVKGAPWTFNNHLLVFHHLKQGEDPLEVDLLYTEFWVQIYNPPHGFFTEAIAKQFGDFIGVFVDYDVKAIIAGLRNYMWIRVKVDIRQRRKELPLEWDISLKAPPCRAATGSSVWLREPTEIWGGYQGIPKNEEGKLGKNLVELNLMRNNGANLGLNLYGKSKHILNEELVSMEFGSTEEDWPITGGEGKKMPRRNNVLNASITDEMIWRNDKSREIENGKDKKEVWLCEWGGYLDPRVTRGSFFELV
ncbi:hypothetical protein Gotur_030209, partial [Gossypium turneri]